MHISAVNTTSNHVIQTTTGASTAVNAQNDVQAVALYNDQESLKSQFDRHKQAKPRGNDVGQCDFQKDSKMAEDYDPYRDEFVERL